MTNLRKITRMSWRKFLSTEFGQEGMLYLRERIPNVSVSDANSMIFQAGKAEGYKEAINMISEVISIQEKPEESLENE